jgi:hypothetical protein
VNRQTDRQREQTDRQADRQADRQTGTDAQFSYVETWLCSFSTPWHGFPTTDILEWTLLSKRPVGRVGRKWRLSVTHTHTRTHTHTHTHTLARSQVDSAVDGLEWLVSLRGWCYLHTRASHIVRALQWCGGGSACGRLVMRTAGGATGLCMHTRTHAHTQREHRAISKDF